MHLRNIGNADLGRAMGISGQAAGKYRVKSVPQSERVEKMAAGLQVSKEELMDRIVNRRPLTDDEVTAHLKAKTADPLRSGYTTEEEWSDRNGVPHPDTHGPEPVAPPGIVLVLVYRNDRGEPIYGFDHTGKVHQLGPAISVTVGLSSTSSATSES